MLAKIYWYTWLVIAAAAGLFFLTGNMTLSAVVVFGFIAFGMVFMGMMGVLPATVAQPAPKMNRSSSEVPVRSTASTPLHHGAHSVRA